LKYYNTSTRTKNEKKKGEKIMIIGIDHVGIAVKNLEKTLSLHRDVLGLEVKRDIMNIEDQKMRNVLIKVGNSSFEIMEPTDPASAVAKYIEVKGEGVQHISLKVDNIEETIAILKEKGIVFTSEKPLQYGSAKVIFAHPKSTGGILFEFCERAE